MGDWVKMIWSLHSSPHYAPEITSIWADLGGAWRSGDKTQTHFQIVVQSSKMDTSFVEIEVKYIYQGWYEHGGVTCAIWSILSYTIPNNYIDLKQQKLFATHDHPVWLNRFQKSPFDCSFALTRPFGQLRKKNATRSNYNDSFKVPSYRMNSARSSCYPFSSPLPVGIPLSTRAPTNC